MSRFRMPTHAARSLVCAGLLAWGGAVGQAPLRVSVNGVGLPPGRWRGADTLRLPARERTLTIDLETTGPDTARYRLDGYETAWQPFVRTAHLRYDHLAGGHYVLRVKTGGGSVPVVGLPIEVENLPWQHWWVAPALFGYGLLVMGALMFLFFRYRLRQQTRLFRLRDDIARDLHDDMGSYLSSISILSQNAGDLAVRDPVRARATLQKIGETARQVMDLMGDIVWSVNPSHDALEQVAVRMRAYAHDLFESLPTRVHFEADDAALTLKLPLEKRRDFFLMYKEMLTNSARYADASEVRIALQQQQGTLHLTVRDDGCGFDPAAPPRSAGGNGLKNLQSRAANLGGTLAIASAPGQGTTISFIFSV